MNTINDGGPAFPETRIEGDTYQEVQWCGMSLRDYFAAKAMQSLISRAGFDECMISRPKETLSGVCGGAYKIADAMIAERDRVSE